MMMDWLLIGCALVAGTGIGVVVRGEMDRRKNYRATVTRELSEIIDSTAIPIGGTLVLRSARALSGQEREALKGCIEVASRDRGMQCLVVEPPFDISATAASRQ